MPLPNEHACRLSNPGKYDRFRRGTRDHDGKQYSIIYGRPKGGGGWEQQAFRYPSGTWTADQARSHCSSHQGQEFAAATGGKSYDEHLDAIADLLTDVDAELRELILEHLGALATQGPPDPELHAEWTTSYINNLPDSAFAYIEPGGSKDSEGKTVPRSLRHFPHHDANGKLDLPHLRNALGRAGQSPHGDRALPHLNRHAAAAGVGEHAQEPEAAELACLALRDYVDYLASAPLPDPSVEQWAASVTTNMERVRDALRHRAAKHALAGADSPQALYDRMQARDARLRTLLGKDR